MLRFQYVYEFVKRFSQFTKLGASIFEFMLALNLLNR